MARTPINPRALGGTVPPEPVAPPPSADTVTVACKLPNGLCLDMPDPMGGPPLRVVVKGPAIEIGGQFPEHQIVGGYGLTPGVPKDYWDAWAKEHEHMEVVRRGFIFAHGRQADAATHAKDLSGEKCGLEPISPDNPGPGLERIGVGGA